MKQVGGAADIVVGRDGVLLRKDDHSAVFLPSSSNGTKMES